MFKPAVSILYWRAGAPVADLHGFELELGIGNWPSEPLPNFRVLVRPLNSRPHLPDIVSPLVASATMMTGNVGLPTHLKHSCIQWLKIGMPLERRTLDVESKAAKAHVAAHFLAPKRDAILLAGVLAHRIKQVGR
jgi:hypothetical protein